MTRARDAARRPALLHGRAGWPEQGSISVHVSWSGITFPRSAELRDTARGVPLDRALVETDSPFLAPPPHRGKRNEPAFVARVADTLAELHGIPAADVRQRTAANFHALFRP